MLDLKDFVASPLMSMHNLYRYSSCRQAEPESLSDHIVEIQVIGSYLVNVLNTKFNENISYGEFLAKAFHHDMEESVSGDIVRPLKYHTPEMKQSLDLAADEISQQIYNFYFPDSNYRDYYLQAKQGKAGSIVKIADLLVVAVKAFREVELLGNLYFLKVIHEVSIYLTGLLAEVKDMPFGRDAKNFLKQYISRTIDQLVSVKEKYNYIYREYNLKNNSLIGNQTLEGADD